MTVKRVYTFRMNALLSTAFIGFIWLGVLFGVCFACVHIAKLARLGYLYGRKRKPTSPAPPPQKTNEPAPKQEKQPSSADGEKEPVYYIVERKRRVKTGYSQPKEIKFR